MTRRSTSSMTRLTPKRLQLLRLIRDYQARHGFSPTLQELADMLGVTKVTVFEHIAGLEKDGLVRHARHRARSLEFSSRVQFPDDPPHGLRLIGYIAAGSPIEAIENPEVIRLDELFSRRGNVYALKVRGDSMIDEHIADGDVVIVEQRETARNGETVVALLDNGEATLKTYYQERGRVRLQPANPRYEPIYVKNPRIQGVVIGVLRTYR